MGVKQSRNKISSQNLDESSMPRFFSTLKKFTKVATLPASGGFKKILSVHVDHTKIFNDLHKYFRFSPQLFNIMKKLCKRAMT